MSDFDKQLYWERRNKGLPGTPAAVTVHRVVKDEEGNDQRVAIGSTAPTSIVRNKQSGSRARRREAWKNWRRQERKASNRGE